MELRVYFSRVQRRAGRIVPAGPPVDVLHVVRGSHCDVALGIVTRIRHRAEEAGQHVISFALDCGEGEMAAEVSGALHVELPPEDGVFAPDVVVQAVVLAPGGYVLRASVDGTEVGCAWAFQVVRAGLGNPGDA